MVFSSPTKRVAVEIWQTRIESSMGMRMYRSPNEALAYFVHVYWSADETKVGVIATGNGLWELAFDVGTGTPISFSEIRDGLARSIGETYHFVGTHDPVAWASSTEAQSRFFELHPEIHVSYGPRR
jgi:hypothetical protein